MNKLNSEGNAINIKLSNYKAASKNVELGTTFTESEIALPVDLPQTNDILIGVKSIMEDMGIDVSNRKLKTKMTDDGILVSYLDNFTLTEEQLSEIQRRIQKDAGDVFSAYNTTIEKLEKEKFANEAQKKAAWKSTLPSMLASLNT